MIVNPSTPIGPRDVKPTPTGRIIVEAACGRMPAFVDTGLNLVHVDDVAAGHLAALERGAIGERYILGGENVTFAEMLADIAAGRPQAAARCACRARAVMPFAYAAEALGALHRPRAVRHRRWPAHGRNTACSSRRPRPSANSAHVRGPICAGLDDAIDWFRETGYLDRK